MRGTDSSGARRASAPAALLALLVGGIAAIALLAVGGLITADAIDSLSETRIGETRTPLPGQRAVQLEERKYVVYYEVDDSSAPAGDHSIVVPRLEVTIRGSEDGSALPLRDYGGSFTVESGGRVGVAWRTVEVPRAGRYRIRAAGRTDDFEPAVVLGKPTLRRILRLVLGISGLAAGLGLAALIVALVIALRTRRASV